MAGKMWRCKWESGKCRAPHARLHPEGQGKSLKLVKAGMTRPDQCFRHWTEAEAITKAKRPNRLLKYNYQGPKPRYWQ